MSDMSWNEKYTKSCDPTKSPSRFLVEQIDRLPLGRALDLATGSGRNAIYLAKNGYAVDAIDYSGVAVSQLKSFVNKQSLAVSVKQKDLTTFQIPEVTYDLIINFNYLERSLIPQMIKGLKPGGMILFETYTIEQPRYGKPHNPDYLLKPNELIKSFKELHIIYYHERVDHSSEETKAIASLLAQKL
jgi:SAM-dependent methyltransferase